MTPLIPLFFAIVTALALASIAHSLRAAVRKWLSTITELELLNG